MKLLLPLLLLLSCTAFTNAQTDSTSTDSTATPSGISFGKGGFSLGASSPSVTLKKPTITMLYGLSGVSIHGNTSTINTVGSIDVGIGGIHVRPVGKDSTVGDVSRSGVLLGFFSPDYTSKTDTAKPIVKGWKIGFLNTSGYAYLDSDKEPTLSLLHEGSMVWTSVNSTIPAGNLDGPSISAFDHSYFGYQTGAIVRYNVTNGIALDAQWQRGVLYNDFSFFGWLGSVIIEQVGVGLLDGMVMDGMKKKSVKSLPVANLILRTALSFGFSELRRSTQHFPFKSSSPMIFDGFRIGTSISF
ncbi:MAG: hypothetical protein U0Y96_14620 [Candidatus Kapaibacterium sp.]